MVTSIRELRDKRQRWVEANRENGFESGLKRLLTDLYPDSAHFVYELLQNAEDAQATEVSFSLRHEQVSFDHDSKRLFSLADVEAITSIGSSQKRDDPTTIGKFGVGFKAVFSYTDSPEIESGEFHFRIRDLVVPEPARMTDGQLLKKRTRFTLPFNNPKKTSVAAVSEIHKLLTQLDAATLLFLTHIRKISYFLPDESGGCIERIDRGNGRCEVVVTHPGYQGPSSEYFVKFDKVVQIEDDEVVGEAKQMKNCRLSVAFGLVRGEKKDSVKQVHANRPEGGTEWELVPLEPGRVCIYFPADKETSNLRFHLHAPFASTVARDSVRSCTGNGALRDHLADLLAESMHEIRDQGLLTVRALAVLPNNKDNLPDFYRPLQARLVQEFKQSNLTPMKRGGHAAAISIFMGTRDLLDVLDDDDMVLLLGDEYLPPMWVTNPPQRNQREHNFLETLGIRDWTISDLASALVGMDGTTRIAWMKAKPDGWHQALYALLKKHADAAESDDAAYSDLEMMKSIPLVKTGDGSYKLGKECFFPSDKAAHDAELPYVACGVCMPGDLHRDSIKQKDARSFLEIIGVRESDEQALIKVILERRYAPGVERPSYAQHYSDMRRFIDFSERNLSIDVKPIFADYQMLLVGEGKSDWMAVSNVYLNLPFMDKGVRLYLYYDAIKDKNPDRHQLANVYQESEIPACRIGSFVERLGGRSVSYLPVEKVGVTPDHPEWDKIRRDGGCRSRRGKGKNEDYIIPFLAEYCAEPTTEKALVLWLTMCRYHLDSVDVTTAKYGLNESHLVMVRSTLIHSLASIKWIPQFQDDGEVFVQPAYAVTARLPEMLRGLTDMPWLNSIGFGESAGRGVDDGQCESESRRTAEVLRAIGFESVEEAREMLRLKRDNPEGYRRLKEKASFPESLAPDPERRRQKAAENAENAPPRASEERPRQVPNDRNKSPVDAYLRDLYTRDNLLFCQLCHEEMPFRKRNGQHYFNRVRAFNLTAIHPCNYFALCPVCAAKYLEFVVKDPGNARKALEDAFLTRAGAGLELPVQLGSEDATIRFVGRHAEELRGTINGDRRR